MNIQLNDLFKIPLYRIIFPIGVSSLAFLLFHDYINLKEILKNVPEKLHFVIIFSVLILVGELFCFAGELVINIFFDYSPLNFKDNDLKMEKVKPCSNEYITYRDFDNLKKKNRDIALEMSEVHFVLSRVFAGTFIVFMISLFTLISKEYNITYGVLVVLVVLYILLVIIPILFKLFKLVFTHIKSRRIKIFNVVFLLLPVILLIIANSGSSSLNQSTSNISLSLQNSSLNKTSSNQCVDQNQTLALLCCYINQTACCNCSCQKQNLTINQSNMCKRSTSLSSSSKNIYSNKCSNTTQTIINLNLNSCNNCSSHNQYKGNDTISKQKYPNQLKFILLFLGIIISFIGSIYYRTHANKLIYFNR